MVAKENKLRGNKERLLVYIGMGLVIFLLVCFGIFLWKDTSNFNTGKENGQTSGDTVAELGISKWISNLQGFSRSVHQDEYDFYAKLVKRDLAEEVEEEEFDKLVKAYIEEVNAVFYLASKLELYEPYSFELLQMRMEQENERRKIALENDEPVYGLEQFDLTSYFNYEFSNLDTSLINYILEYADEAILEGAREYYERKPEKFRVLEEVAYEETINSVTEEKTATREEIHVLEKSDPNLADFLLNTEIGNEYSDYVEDGVRKVKIIDVTWSDGGFEENKTTVLENYIKNVWFDETIAMVAEQNPLVFELDNTIQ